MDSFDAFAEQLAGMPAPLFTINPYQGQDMAGLIRRQNLSHYLGRMAGRRPRLLLVGEAPGYRGCGVTGVPFTSEALLMSGRSPFDLFGANAGFRPAGSESRWKREATATIMWRALEEIGVLPLLWNAFPFHPHGPDQPASNRPPKPGELELGRRILPDLLALFDIAQVIAVGNKAAAALSDWGIPAERVRHPSRGGKLRFERELAQLVAADGAGTA